MEKIEAIRKRKNPGKGGSILEYIGRITQRGRVQLL